MYRIANASLINPPIIQRASPSQNGQPHRQLDNPPGSKTMFCLDFVLITFGCQERLYLANVCLVEIFFSSLVSRKLLGRSCGGKLVPCVLVVEVAPACGKLPADVDLRISTGERHGYATSLISRLVRSPPYFRESSCLLVRLPSWQDVADEPDAAVQHDADWYSGPLPPYRRVVGVHFHVEPINYLEHCSEGLQMRNFCPGLLRLDSIWEASWPFTTGRNLGLGFLGFVSAPRQHYLTSMFVHPGHRQVQTWF